MDFNFSFNETSISGLVEITSFNRDDSRGCFTKDYSEEVFERAGFFYEIREVFYTTSVKGVIRALHFQKNKQQPKLVRCIFGHIWDVVVDLRIGSPTFKKWCYFDLTDKNKKEVLVPAGCAHGYLVLEDSIVSYKCAEKFYPEYDTGIRWDDPELGISWPLELVGGRERIIISRKDQTLKSLQDYIKDCKSL